MATVTSTFTATNGTQSKTLAHQFNVQAAGPKLIAHVTRSGDGNNFDHSFTFDPVAIPAHALLVLEFSNVGSGHIASAPSDGNTWVKAFDIPTGASQSQSVWYCLDANASTAHAITVSLSSGSATYGAALKVYSPGTWTYDASNSGSVNGAYSQGTTSTPALSASGAGVVSVVWGQYDDSLVGAVASMAPGDIVAQSDDGSGHSVMACGEIVHASAFSGAITCGLNTTPASYTKVDVIYTSFNYAP